MCVCVWRTFSCFDVWCCRRFKPSEGVIVIAATNFPESLDKALIRPGRFDRRVTCLLLVQVAFSQVWLFAILDNTIVFRR